MPRRGKQGAIPSAIRMIRMMQLIPWHRPGSRRRISAPRLREKLVEEGYRISLRTVQRDLHRLSEVFPGLQNDGADLPGWFWADREDLHDIPAMDAPIALAFKLAEQYLRPVAPTVTDSLAPYLSAAGKALDEQARDWLSRVAIVPRNFPLRPAKVAPEVARTVQVALLERRRIRVRYRPRGREPAEYELSPHGLVLRHEVSYLVATAWDYTDPRHYALHRMEPESLELLESPCTGLEGFNLERYIEQGAFQYRLAEEPVHLVLRLRREVAYHLRETPLADDQHTEPPEGEWQVVRATVPDTLQLRWWLLGLGDQVVVERPASLREELLDTLRSTLSRYQET